MKGPVAAIHHHLRHHGDNGNAAVSFSQSIGERLLKVIADIPLAHGTAHVKGHGRSDIGGSFRGQQDAPHLRAVAVNDSQLIPGAGELRQIFCGTASHLQL